VGRSIAVFAVSSVVTLTAGALLELSGDRLATREGINGVIFGATVLALATALPEISSGIAAVRIGDHQLARATSSAATRSRCASSCWPT
jgi:cation:H+ antiporter